MLIYIYSNGLTLLLRVTTASTLTFLTVKFVHLLCFHKNEQYILRLLCQYRYTAAGLVQEH